MHLADWFDSDGQESATITGITGWGESVRRFIEFTALEVGWGAIEWEGEDILETGIRSRADVVQRIDLRYLPPDEVETLLEDPSKSHIRLSWQPTTLEQLVEHGRQEALLGLKGCQVAGSIENQATSPLAVEQARSEI